MRVLSAASYLVLIAFPLPLNAQRSRSITSPIRDVVQSTLTAPEGIPFHLKAVITQGSDNSLYGVVEMFWFAPDHYEREITSKEFSQTLVVDGQTLFENDSSDYFPLELRTLVTAMVDPKPILDAVRDGDRVVTKANGGTSESGATCYGKGGTMCVNDPAGMREVVAASGHAVTFADYQPFEGKPVARLLTNAARLGEEPLRLRIIALEAIRSPPVGQQFRL